MATEVEEEETIPISRCKHDALNASTPTALFEPPIALALGGAAARRASAFGNEELAPSAADRLSLTVRPATSPEGLVLVRGFCRPDEANSIYSALDSADAASRSWTGLKHGGGSVKCYTGTTEGMGLFNNKYKRVWGRARHTEFLQSGELAAARDRIVRLINHPAGGFPRGQVLLTEQLIKYAKDDAFFNLHWDMDSATPEEPLPSGSGSELGPGDIIAALNLRCCTTILFQPRYKGGDAGKGRVKVQLEHGDLYIMSGPARWSWLHGVSVHPQDALLQRRAVVWRFKTVLW